MRCSRTARLNAAAVDPVEMACGRLPVAAANFSVRAHSSTGDQCPAEGCARVVEAAAAERLGRRASGHRGQPRRPPSRPAGSPRRSRFRSETTAMTTTNIPLTTSLQRSAYCRKRSASSTREITSPAECARQAMLAGLRVQHRHPDPQRAGASTRGTKRRMAQAKQKRFGQNADHRRDGQDHRGPTVFQPLDEAPQMNR